jgi:hypothetical protein
MVIAKNRKMYAPSKKRGKMVMGNIIPKAHAIFSDLSSPSTNAAVLTCAFESLSKSVI